MTWPRNTHWCRCSTASDVTWPTSTAWLDLETLLCICFTPSDSTRPTSVTWLDLETLTYAAVPLLQMWPDLTYIYDMTRPGNTHLCSCTTASDVTWPDLHLWHVSTWKHSLMHLFHNFGRDLNYIRNVTWPRNTHLCSCSTASDVTWPTWKSREAVIRPPYRAGWRLSATTVKTPAKTHTRYKTFILLFNNNRWELK